MISINVRPYIQYEGNTYYQYLYSFLKQLSIYFPWLYEMLSSDILPWSHNFISQFDLKRCLLAMQKQASWFFAFWSRWYPTFKYGAHCWRPLCFLVIAKIDWLLSWLLMHFRLNSMSRMILHRKIVFVEFLYQI